jgi:hypothetical protein
MTDNMDFQSPNQTDHKSISGLLGSILVILVVLGTAFWYLKMKKDYGFSTKIIENAPTGTLASGALPEMILAKDAVIEDSAQYVVSEASKNLQTQVTVTTYNTKTSRDTLGTLYENYAKHAGFTDIKTSNEGGVTSLSARKMDQVLFVVVKSLSPTFSEVRVTLDKETK